MSFSIITPSFRHSSWLKLCIASVADQDLPHEHIVQDSCSDDGTQDWLPRDPRVTAVIEKDTGMYDAVNRGYRRARGELLAYINCDEQYLPGALRKVSEFFDRNPSVDVVFGDCVVIDGEGQYICERRVLVPQRYHTMVGRNLSFLTVGTFLRRRVIDQHQLFFNPKYRDVGDTEWTSRLIKAGLSMAVLGDFTSAFTETGVNMNLGPNARRETQEFYAAAPAWARAAAPLFVALYRLRRWRAGYYRPRKFDYAVYTKASPDARQKFSITKPTALWKRVTAASEAN
jgi:glycosyltransferase involved in cell wall biosynthesis